MLFVFFYPEEIPAFQDEFQHRARDFYGRPSHRAVAGHRHGNRHNPLAITDGSRYYITMLGIAIANCYANLATLETALSREILPGIVGLC